MADNSGSKQNKNNNRNPTLRDHERMQGRSGHAIHDKDVRATTGKEDMTGRGGSSGQSSSGGQTFSRDSGHN